MRFKDYIESVEDGCEIIKLKPTQRVHASKRSQINPEDEPSQGINDKPRGLWYACGDEWIKWCRGENFRVDHLENKFLLDIDFTKILVLDTVKKIDEFSKIYGVQKYPRPNKERNWRHQIDSIDWQKVSEIYSGIEICPYHWELRHEFMWYYPWDVASGCIWDKRAVNKVTKIGST